MLLQWRELGTTNVACTPYKNHWHVLTAPNVDFAPLDLSCHCMHYCGLVKHLLLKSKLKNLLLETYVVEKSEEWVISDASVAYGGVAPLSLCAIKTRLRKQFISQPKWNA
ncbi:hypothetical protein E1A91_A02G069200v1 [Gossypium mustelinum]|uniref:Uncharacterized protein n=1 Tax=Gossypium mustelinum TaxID=34275 RepID=A0A5D3A609_GOSMU|nr:hypothetical protein E1A91_A02G069200v1 [Gossypium mustelinum]